MQIPGWQPPQLYGVVPPAGFQPPTTGAVRGYDEEVTGEALGYAKDAVDLLGPMVPAASSTAAPDERGLGPGLKTAEDFQKQEQRSASLKAAAKAKKQALLGNCIASRAKVLVADQLLAWSEDDVAFEALKIVQLLAQVGALNVVAAKKAKARADFVSASAALESEAAQVLVRPFMVPVVPFAGGGHQTLYWVAAAWALPQWGGVATDFMTVPLSLGATKMLTAPSGDQADVDALADVLARVSARAVQVAAAVVQAVNAPSNKGVVAAPQDWAEFQTNPQFVSFSTSPGLVARTAFAPDDKQTPLGPGLTFAQAVQYAVQAGEFAKGGKGGGGGGWVQAAPVEKVENESPWLLQWMRDDAKDWGKVNADWFLAKVPLHNATRAVKLRQVLAQILDLYATTVLVHDLSSGGKVSGLGKAMAQLRDVYGLEYQPLFGYLGDGSDWADRAPSPPPPQSPMLPLVKVRNTRYAELEEAKATAEAYDWSGLSDLMQKYAEVAAKSQAAAELAYYGGTQRLKGKVDTLTELYDEVDALYFAAYGYHLPELSQDGANWDEVAAQVEAGAANPKPGSLAYAVAQVQAAYDAAKAAYNAALDGHGAASPEAVAAGVAFEAAKAALAAAKVKLAKNFMLRTDKRSDLTDQRASTYKRANGVEAQAEVVIRSDGQIVGGTDDEGKYGQAVYHPSAVDKEKAQDGAAAANAAVKRANTAGGAVVGTGKGMAEWTQEFDLPVPMAYQQQAAANSKTAETAAEKHTDTGGGWLALLLAAATLYAQAKE